MTTHKAELIRVSKDSVAISGEPLAYPNSPDPEMTASIMPIPPGGKTEWMTHPVPAYAYILEGELTVEFAVDGSRKKFKAGEGFLQARSAWHRGRNDGQTEMKPLERDGLVAVGVGPGDKRSRVIGLTEKSGRSVRPACRAPMNNSHCM
jgi:quercetin dioxygenase-like cupin family protein